MTTMTPTTAAEAVANGAQLLDEEKPGWWRRINLGTLDLADCGQCICGQLAVDSGLDLCPVSLYEHTMEELGLVWLDTDRLYGFNLMEENGDDEKPQEEVESEWRELEWEWHQVIRARLEADALVPAEQQKKEVYA